MHAACALSAAVVLTVLLLAGVIRAIPVGVAYRDASADVLREAADAAVVFTHPTERGSEGAVAIAAAVAWLTKCAAPLFVTVWVLQRCLTRNVCN